MRVAMILPRNMRFGPHGATAIDLCVRDLVAHSSRREVTRLFIEPIDEPFQGFDLCVVPRGEYGWRFIKPLHAFDPDVIMVQQHRPTASLLARWFGNKPVILHRHGLLKRPKDPFNRWRINQGHRRLAGLIAASEAVEYSVAEIAPSLRGRTHIVHNGLDFQDWHPSSNRRREILFVGRLAPEKGVLEAAEGVMRLLGQQPDWRATFMFAEENRHPAYKACVLAMLIQRPDQIRIVTSAPHSTVKQAFETASIALVPSVWAEPFGRTALEALAGGAALITSAGRLGRGCRPA